MNNLNAYTEIDEKKRKRSPILVDVKGSIDSFNHAVSGVGNIPGTGAAMSEDIRNDIPVNDDIFVAIQNEFPTTDFPEKGASYILPDGKFLHPDSAHGEVDEFIVDNFPEIDLMDYPNGYLVDSEQCVRVNDGRGKSFTFDRYITLPKTLTNNQIYFIEDWLKEYPYEEITVSDTGSQKAEFDLSRDGITYIMNRIKKYRTSRILSEDVEDKDLPDVADGNIIKEEDAGVSSMFIDLINECWNIIDTYHSVIVTLDSLNRHEYDETLKDLLEDHNREVGALQGILELLSPSGEKIENGKEEAQSQVAFDEVHENFDLKESKKLTEEEERELYIKAGLDPDIDRTPGSRPDGSYYDDRGFHWDSNGHLLAEVNSRGAVVVPKEWEEWWT